MCCLCFFSLVTVDGIDGIDANDGIVTSLPFCIHSLSLFYLLSVSFTLSLLFTPFLLLPLSLSVSFTRFINFTLFLSLHHSLPFVHLLITPSISLLFPFTHSPLTSFHSFTPFIANTYTNYAYGNTTSIRCINSGCSPC